VKILRVLVDETLGHALAHTPYNDLVEACDTLERKGRLHERDRRRVKTGVGY
jgi:glutamate decarboxylase